MRLALVCLAAAVVVGGAAVLDHTWKQRRIERAEVAEWYCRHVGTRCGGPSSKRIEARWNTRQTGYEVAVVALVAVAAVGGARRARSG
jgi:hypothetical protein